MSINIQLTVDKEVVSSPVFFFYLPIEYVIALLHFLCEF